MMPCLLTLPSDFTPFCAISIFVEFIVCVHTFSSSVQLLQTPVNQMWSFWFFFLVCYSYGNEWHPCWAINAIANNSVRKTILAGNVCPLSCLTDWRWQFVLFQRRLRILHPVFSLVCSFVLCCVVQSLDILVISFSIFFVCESHLLLTFVCDLISLMFPCFGAFYFWTYENLFLSEVSLFSYSVQCLLWR
jgi:hypothetical protein